jgi:hypothetical protein
VIGFLVYGLRSARIIYQNVAARLAVVSERTLEAAQRAAGIDSRISRRRISLERLAGPESNAELTCLSLQQR